ncbi:MAG: cell filamentation protein Fic [Chloroflexi bacterium B3_Chlor]|nr:MAG: cell filamentation protein Fic [Chloroflexi bacterium B3_Chlor]
MDPERFHKSAAGQVVRAGAGQGAYWAFVPHELPPSLSWDTELVLALSKADLALGELAGLGRNMPNPHLLVGPFVRREAILSSRIEGTQTDIADLYGYEAGQLPLQGLARPAPPESDVREVLNYVRALEYGLERLDTLPVSLRLIRELHERLMDGVRGEHATPGEFRRTQNWIGPPGCTLNEAEFVPPPVPEMQGALDAFERYLCGAGDYPPLVRLAFIHYQFEAIHPFVDGNGRIGRLLTSLLLVEREVLPLPLLYLSAFFEQHRQDYYDLLMGVSEQGAWREWVEFFLHGAAEQAGDASVRAKRLQDLQVGWRVQLQEARVSGWILGLGDSLFESPMLSATGVQKRFGVSHPTAMQALRRLEEKEILKEITGGERNRVYVAAGILEIME